MQVVVQQMYVLGPPLRQQLLLHQPSLVAYGCVLRLLVTPLWTLQMRLQEHLLRVSCPALVVVLLHLRFLW